MWSRERYSRQYGTGLKPLQRRNRLNCERIGTVDMDMFWIKSRHECFMRNG
jgi:hypothetical protein